jgi:hypothetical protein
VKHFSYLADRQFRSDPIDYKCKTIFICVIGKLVGHHLVLRILGPCAIIFMNMCAVTTDDMVILVGDFGAYRII